ncbi:MAG: hypothetical protein ACI4W2_04275, partial [Eubacterium sp.]
GLDPVVTQEMYELIDTINKQLGITIIMVSHDMHAALKYAKHILQLHQKQLFYGTTDEYIGSDIGRKFIGESEDAGLLKGHQKEADNLSGAAEVVQPVKTEAQKRKGEEYA